MSPLTDPLPEEPRPAEPPPSAVEPSVDELSAILLAGGRGSRLGGVEKALLRRGEHTQIRRWLQALQRRDICTVVVGPPSLKSQIPATVPLVRETPAFAGPAAGVLAGAAELRRRRSDAGSSPHGWTLLLAVDLAEPAPLLDWLLAELCRSGDSAGVATDASTAPGGGHTAVLPCDGSGRQQYLSAAVPTGWLLDRAAQLAPGEVEHRPLRWLLDGLDDDAMLHRPVVPRGLSEDVDTPEDAHRLGLRLPRAARL